MECPDIVILVRSSRRRCKLPYLCPLVYLFLRGVAKLKNLQDEVSYVLDYVAEAWWYPKMLEKLRVSMKFD